MNSAEAMPSGILAAVPDDGSGHRYSAIMILEELLKRLNPSGLDSLVCPLCEGKLYLV